MLDTETLLIAAVIAIGAGVMIPTLEGPKDTQVAVSPLPARAAASRPQLPPSAVPVQRQIAGFDVDLGHGFHASAIHSYTIAGKILVSRAYNWDRTAKISPLDLAIGWGEMASPDVFERFIFKGGKRLVHIRPTSMAEDVRAIMNQWSNSHIIPASTAVRAQVLALEPGQTVRLHGYLVNVSGPGGLIWEGSTSRDDQGFTACEVFMVERVEVIEIPTDAQAEADT